MDKDGAYTSEEEAKDTIQEAVEYLKKEHAWTANQVEEFLSEFN